MNYTGRPSISGCRPVLSLYPTHCFCQYLLRIFITFTNSSLFTRAFSTNSRRPLRHAAGVTAPPEGEELNLSVSADALPPPLPRGGFGSPRKVNGFARGSPTRGNGDDRRQWRKQGGAVGAAASKTQAERGGCWEPQPGLVERSETERLYEGETFLCGKIRLAASFPVSFGRIICYNGFAALPAHLFGRGGEKNGKYSFFYTVCRSKCSSLLYLQVA